jgi:nucleoside-diphosphate-sugar epimerase
VIAKAQRLLGFAPGVTLAEGLARTIEWTRDDVAAGVAP